MTLIRMMLRRVSVLCVLLLLCSCAPPEPIRIGFVGGLSGWAPDFGIDGLHGARLAVELRNKAGGSQGRPIELIEADDQQDAAMAKQAVTRLINRRVDAIIGPMTSAIAAATVPLINEAKTVMISPSVTTNDLSAKDDHFFRVVPATREFVKTFARFHFESWGLRRLRVIRDLGNFAFTESWVRDFSGAFASLGGETLEPLAFTSGDVFDFSELVRRALVDQPDGLVIVANSVDTAMLCAAIRKLDRETRISTSEWGSTGRLIELGGQSVEGVAVEYFFNPRNATPSFVEFRDAFIQRFGQPPGYGGVYAFDATNILLDTLERRKSGESLKEALLAGKPHAGVQSEITFDRFGDVNGRTFVLVVRDGDFVVPPFMER